MTVTVPVTLVPVVALLVDMLVDTVDTDAKAACDNNRIPKIESVIIIFWFMSHHPYGLNTSPTYTNSEIPPVFVIVPSMNTGGFPADADGHAPSCPGPILTNAQPAGLVTIGLAWLALEPSDILNISKYFVPGGNEDQSVTETFIVAFSTGLAVGFSNPSAHINAVIFCVAVVAVYLSGDPAAEVKNTAVLV